MFKLNPAVQAKVRNVEVLSHKNREPDANPGAKISLTVKVPNAVVGLIHPDLFKILWEKNKSAPQPPQGQLEGTEVSERPNLTPLGAHLPTLPYSEELTGYTFTQVWGTANARSNRVLKDCTLTNWKIQPHEGGTSTIKFVVECQDVGGNGMWDALAKLKGTTIEIIVEPPVVDDSQAKIPTAAPAAKSSAKKAEKGDATEQFLARHGAGEQLPASH